MSECLDCGKPMHPADASRFYECHECRAKAKKLGKDYHVVKGMPSEHLGRKARNTKALGAEMNSSGDDF